MHRRFFRGTLTSRNCTQPNPAVTMIVRESQQFCNFGRGAYDTTGVPKPPPPKPR
ncbi:6765e8b9-4dc2-4a8b-a4b2-29684ddcf16d [Thermothielavioides terrestris]|uniref:6765e8b9-4dc2-4a8b-a4b2-29684ddcf16d n=1 Tax=Thermothielavioides terrestris TaxID=2587410 RepID=A0A446BDL4_9PEZI|nr:6765e8b9-4dc2-4a8b-a4b2-29684ddcf16d [Thermothielavioides terrestris]